ncbi:hypothetical protein [Micromonospora zhanjiangensis]|uniref:Uncharacterized protein n=1 Tax=Micromonospora zhanjiangensis TaxID=1522057 RepID=A0ABV8KRZ6_9ACTN
MNAKIHPAFIMFFILSLLTMIAAAIMAAMATDACDSLSASTAPWVSVQCQVEGQSQTTTALVVAIGGLTAMLGGVGFQINRHLATAPAAVPQMPPPPAGYGAPGGYPPPGFAPHGNPAQPPRP